MLHWLGELVAPQRCAACDELTSLLFCDGCSVTVEPASMTDAALLYGGAVEEAIARLKYRGRSDLAARLAAVMVDAAPREIDVVVPVPLHPLRAAERGFNQSALLAGPLSRALGVRFEPRALERIRHTPRQATLGRSERLMNVVAAFRCRRPKAIAGKRVLLVDDVRTTGATLAECAAVLEKASAKAIFPFVLAARDELPDSP